MASVTLPNNTTTTNTSGTYVVGDNGNYTFKAYDKLGNERIVTESINNIDKIKPEGVLSLDSEGLTDGQINILWQATDGQSGFAKIILPDATVSTQATGRFPVTKIGEYTFIIYDKVGNDRQVSIIVNNVDKEPPTINITQRVTRWTNEDVTLHWEAYDKESGLKYIVLPNGERKTEQSGNHNVTQNGTYLFLAYDQIGNGAMVSHEVSNIDKMSPTLNLNAVPDDEGNVSIIWEMSDSQSGTRNLILPDGRNTNDKTGIFTAKENGTYSFIAYDNVGNDTVMTIVVSGIDKIPITYRLWVESLEDGTYQIGWELDDGQDDFAYITLPNGKYTSERTGYFKVLQKGTYTFIAYDEIGNETKHSITVQ